MSTHQMLLITKNRVEIHPDFSAALIAKFRVGQSLLSNGRELAWRMQHLCDDGLDIPEAFESAKQQIRMDVVRSVCAQFWTEFRIAKSMHSKAGGKSPPASDNPTPSI